MNPIHRKGLIPARNCCAQVADVKASSSQGTGEQEGAAPPAEAAYTGKNEQKPRKEKPKKEPKQKQAPKPKEAGSG